MKRVFSVAAALLLCLSLLMNTAAAFECPDSERVDYEDGSYAIITTSSTGTTRATTSDSKTYTYYNSSDQRCFAYTLYATFTYNGVTSSADTVAGGASFYLHGWDIDSHSEWTSGSTAYGSAVFSGPNGESRPVSLSLTCDKNGNVR